MLTVSKLVAVLLMLTVLMCSSVSAKPRAQATKSSSSSSAAAAASSSGHLLQHELTNRVLHADHSRHHEHPELHYGLLVPSSVVSSSNEHHNNSNRPPTAQRNSHKQQQQLLQQQQDALLEGERLMHVKPRNTASNKPRLNTTTGTVGNDRHSNNKADLLLSKSSKQKVAAGGAGQYKRYAAVKARIYGLETSRTKPYNKSHRGGAGATVGKKFNPKKHAWKKMNHKEKIMRSRQMMKEKKERSLAKKEKVMSKELMKAKQLLKKEKAMKKKERKEKRAKVVAYRKRE